MVRRWSKVQTPTGEHFTQDGGAVQKFAIRKTVDTFKTLEEKLNKPLNEHYFISHQANLTMLQSVCKRLAIADEKHFYNIDKFGNTAASGAPTVMSQHINSFKAGDLLTLVVVGAGLSWGGMLIEALLVFFSFLTLYYTSFLLFFLFALALHLVVVNKF